MKAIVYQRFGPPEVAKVVDVASPTCGDRQVLVRVRAAAITSGDSKIRSFMGIPWTLALLSRPLFGWRKPKKPILGGAFAGEIESVGAGVNTFKPGDKVLGFTGMTFGAHAQYLSMNADGVIVVMPENLTFELAAAAPFGMLTAVHFLRCAKIQAGQNVLINGASGAVGLAAVQLAKHHGCHVTGVCSGSNVQCVTDVGADHVIDYTQQDISQSDRKYDIIFDTVGKTTWSQCRRLLTPKGCYMQAVFALRHLLLMLWVNLTGKRKMICTISNERTQDLQLAKTLIEAGDYQPVIDSVYPMDQAAEAHRRVDSGHKVGSVILTMD